MLIEIISSTISGSREVSNLIFPIGIVDPNMNFVWPRPKCYFSNWWTSFKKDNQVFGCSRLHLKPKFWDTWISLLWIRFSTKWDVLAFGCGRLWNQGNWEDFRPLDTPVSQSQGNFREFLALQSRMKSRRWRQILSSEAVASNSGSIQLELQWCRLETL